jgi:hypothetical protein
MAAIWDLPASTCSWDDDTMEVIIYWKRDEPWEALLNDLHPGYDRTCKRAGNFNTHDFQGILPGDSSSSYIRWNTCTSGADPASQTAVWEGSMLRGGATCTLSNGDVITLDFTLYLQGEYPGDEGDIYP